MRKIIHITTFLFIAFAFIGCDNDSLPANDRQFATPIDLKKNDKVSVYDFFSEIEIIPLETTPNSLLSFRSGEPTRMIADEDKYYFFYRQQHIISVFNSDGSFLKKIDHFGEGPEEYISICDFNINRFNKNIEILSEQGKYINVYDPSGDIFIERIRLPNDMPVVSFFQSLTPDAYVFYSASELSELIFYSKKDHQIIRGNYNLPGWVGNTVFLSSINPFYVYNDTVCFEQLYNGDIVAISPANGKLHPRNGWDFGKYNFDLPSIFPKNFEPDDMMELHSKLWEKASNYAAHFRTKENSKYYIAGFMFEDKYRHLIFNKTTEKYVVFEKFAEGVQLFPLWIDEEAIYTVFTPEFLNLAIESSFLSEKNKRTYLQIKEDDNPVVIKYTFKK
jgi:hypothetical protein